MAGIEKHIATEKLAELEALINAMDAGETKDALVAKLAQLKEVMALSGWTL